MDTQKNHKRIIIKFIDINYANKFTLNKKNVIFIWGKYYET